MHAFSLAVGSLLGHPWAKELVKRAQRLVTYFQAAPRAYHKLLEGANSLGIKGRLRSSNKTRFTSIQMMLESVVGLEAAFAFLLNNHESVIQSADIPPIIRDRVFWASTEVLNKILVPFSKVMTAIQAKTATLADITRYWLYLARVLREELPKVAAAGGKTSSCCFAGVVLLPVDIALANHITAGIMLMRSKWLADFMSHCIGAFNMRSKEMNLPECRLALFLDPRYKAAADAPGTLPELVVTVRLHSDVETIIEALLAPKQRRNPSTEDNKCFAGREDHAEAQVQCCGMPGSCQPAAGIQEQQPALQCAAGQSVQFPAQTVVAGH